MSRLRQSIQDLREKVSREKYLVQTRSTECLKLEDETAFMAREDDIEKQRQLGVQRMEELRVRMPGLRSVPIAAPFGSAHQRCVGPFRGRPRKYKESCTPHVFCGTLHARELTIVVHTHPALQAELALQEVNLAETREYNKVLVFMEKRLQKQQVTFEGTLQAYEEALKFRRDELNDSARLLFEVRKEKQAEDQALMRYQDVANRQRIDMEEKLERHRQEAVLMCVTAGLACP